MCCVFCRAKNSPLQGNLPPYWQRRGKPHSSLLSSRGVRQSARALTQQPLVDRRGVAGTPIIHPSPTLPPPSTVIDSWQTTADGAGTPHALRTTAFTAQQHTATLDNTERPIHDQPPRTSSFPSSTPMTPTSRCRSNSTWWRRV